MKEYIEQEAVIKYLAKCADGYSYIEMPTEQAIADIKAIPAADVVEVQRGRWVKMRGMMPPEYHGHYECSLCKWHGKYTFERERDYGYCPNCGAKMDGGTDDAAD